MPRVIPSSARGALPAASCYNLSGHHGIVNEDHDALVAGCRTPLNCRPSLTSCCTRESRSSSSPSKPMTHPCPVLLLGRMITMFGDASCQQPWRSKSRTCMVKPRNLGERYVATAPEATTTSTYFRQEGGLQNLNKSSRRIPMIRLGDAPLSIRHVVFRCLSRPKRSSIDKTKGTRTWGLLALKGIAGIDTSAGQFSCKPPTARLTSWYRRISAIAMVRVCTIGAKRSHDDIC